MEHKLLHEAALTQICWDLVVIEDLLQSAVYTQFSSDAGYLAMVSNTLWTYLKSTGA
jgi:hypothetical protein